MSDIEDTNTLFGEQSKVHNYDISTLLQYKSTRILCKCKKNAPVEAMKPRAPNDRSVNTDETHALHWPEIDFLVTIMLTL